MIIAFIIWWIVDGFQMTKLIEKDSQEKRLRIMNEVSLTTRATA